jgi:hypothetical protein
MEASTRAILMSPTVIVLLVARVLAAGPLVTDPTARTIAWTPPRD